MRPRSMASTSCGQAMEILLIGVRTPGFIIRNAVNVDRSLNGDFLADLHARREHLRRRLAKDLQCQRLIVVRTVARRGVAEDRLAEAGAFRELDVAPNPRIEHARPLP